MSLRYKALASVLVLVTALIISLLIPVRRDVEASTRAGMEEDLAYDGQQLKVQVSHTGEITLAGLRSSLSGETMKEWVRSFSANGLLENMNAKCGEWNISSGSDASICAMRTFPAQEARATAYWKCEDYWIIGAEPAEKAKPAALSPDMHDLVQSSLADVRSVVKVIPIGSALYLCVAEPFFEQANDYAKFCSLRDQLKRLPDGDAKEAARNAIKDIGDPYGAAVAMIELSDSWTIRNRLVRPTIDPSRPENRIHQVLFAAGGVAASTTEERRAATEALAAAKSDGSGVFQASLDLGDGPQVYEGVAKNFDGSPAAVDFRRPGFIAFKNLDVELGPLRTTLKKLSGIGGIIGLTGAIAFYGLAYLVIRRIRAVQAATEKVRGGDFQVTIPVTSRDEVGTLAVAFNNMIKGLQALGLYTDSVLARSVLDNPELLGNKAARHEGTIMFTDIRNFTGITETMDAGALTTQLNEYFSAIGQHVKAESGYLDKFIGDAVMAFWGKPFLETPDHAVRACRAALLCMRATADLRRSWQKEGKPLFFQRIGVATGEVVVGNIGSATKKNFTVIGDSVNLANRLEGASKVYGTEILLDETTAKQAGSAVLVREVDEITVRGKQMPVRVFELLGLASETSTRARRIIEGYGKALRLYRSGDYEKAMEALEELGKSEHEDGPTKWLSGRCAEALAGKAAPVPVQITKSYGPMKD